MLIAGDGGLRLISEQELVSGPEELAARQDRSRSSFVRRELQRTVAEYEAKEALSKSR